MYVACSECYTHYDDSAEEAECGGVGRRGHRKVKPRPVDEHLENATSANAKRRPPKAVGRPKLVSLPPSSSPGVS